MEQWTMCIDVLRLAQFYEIAAQNGSTITINDAGCVEMAGLLRELAWRRKEMAQSATECAVDD